MATGRKGSTSKGGSVRFPDDEDAMGSPVHREDKAKDSAIPALPEPDGNFLVKVGFLRSLHRYEIVFTLPEVPVLGKDVCSLPSSSSPTPRPLLKVNRVTPTPEGGVKVTCEYTTHQEGVLQEELTLVSRGKRDQRLQVRIQARVMDRHHGTPMLLEGVRCLGAEKEKGNEPSVPLYLPSCRDQPSSDPLYLPLL